jgi:diguanylate cyclase (GGDEF)-like protein
MRTWYCYLLIAVAIGLVAMACWKASPAFRNQRLAVLLAALIPFAASAVGMAGGFDNIPDSTPFGFTLMGALTAFAIFREGLFTFSPVAWALIVDQIGDAVAVISSGGRFHDLNPAAVALVRATRPDAPTKLVGELAHGLFGEEIVTIGGRQTELVVGLPAGRAEFHVRCSPLVDRHDRALGSVYVARDVTEANALNLRLVAAHARLVRQVETIEVLRADLVELASRDPLTGLHNRRHLVERFTPLLAAAQTSGDTLAVALFDVDKFKSVNDQYGHLAGDAVLIEFAHLISEQVPAGGLVARWGGEEFFVALPGTDPPGGLAFADGVRRLFERDPTLVAGRNIHCTSAAVWPPTQRQAPRWTTCSTPRTPRCTRPRSPDETSCAYTGIRCPPSGRHPGPGSGRQRLSSPSFDPRIRTGT